MRKKRSKERERGKAGAREDKRGFEVSNSEA